MIGPILKPILEVLRQYFVQPALGITETCKFHYHGIATCPRLFSIRPLFTKFSKIMEVKGCKLSDGPGS